MKKGKNDKVIWSWVMYDWANSAFATTIMAVVLPIYFSDVAAKNLKEGLAVSYWGYTQSIAMLLTAIIAPLLGTLADYTSSKKKFMSFFILLGSSFTSLLYFAQSGDWLLCSILYIVANIGFSASLVFYDAFLPHITSRENFAWVSSLGYAMGYLGGGLLLILNILMIQFPKMFFLPDSLTATRVAFVTVGVWWLLFSIPFFKNIKEEKIPVEKLNVGNYFTLPFERLKRTFSEARKYKELFKFLIAFWLYIDGVGTIIKMAAIYGREVGIGSMHLMGAILLVQFVAFPFAMIFGKIASKTNTKKTIYLTIALYCFITVWAYFMDSAIEFWILAIMVAIGQGGIQALSRSFYAELIPKEKSAEFYSFFSISEKFASIFGPFIFGLVSQFTSSPRNGVFSLLGFFIAGWLILLNVKEPEKQKGRTA